MKKYTTPAEILEALDTIAQKKIKHYLTDWTDYDRPKAEKILTQARPETFFFIARDCGSYLFTETEIRERESALFIYNYYLETDPARVTYYRVDPRKGQIKRMTHATAAAVYMAAKAAQEERRREARTA